LEPTLLLRCAGYLFAALQVQAVRFPNFRYFFSQFSDALFDGPLHEDRLAEHAVPERNIAISTHPPDRK